MVRPRTVVALMSVIAGVVVGAFAIADESAKVTERARMRVGIYESRAVAVAYANSHFLADHMKRLMAQRSEAKAIGDEKRVKEIEAQGEAAQARLHRQGFGSAPVDDIIEQIAEKLPELARSAGVDVIVRKVSYHSSSVEVVDISDALVGLFDPSSKTLKDIEGLLKHPPVDAE